MYSPPKILTNEDMAKIVDTNDEWISQRTGIKQRHISDEHETTSFMGSEAGKIALAEAGMKPEDIDVLMVATFTPDRFLTSTSTAIQGLMGLENAWAFDLNAACSGFLYCLELAGGLLEMSAYKNILIIGSERISKVLDWEDRGTCVLFGDGASAMVVNRDESVSHSISYFTLGSDGTLRDLITIPNGCTENPLTKENFDDRNHYLKMEGSKVFKFAIRTMVQSGKKVLKETGLTGEDIDWLVPHQANQRILEQVVDRLKMPREKLYSNVADYGNVSAASIPLALYEMDQKGLLKEGQNILVAAFGAGLTWGAGLIKW